MLNLLIKKYNKLRKGKLLNLPLFHTKKQYAFIGIGMHSLSNLYPILRYFNISLKYICTESTQHYAALNMQFPGCIFTHKIVDIINDIEVEGVFVCSSPSSHYEIVSKLAAAGKKIFVEKPPCQTLEELENILSIPTLKVCKVGLQRRYWPGNNHLAKKIKSAKNYTYKFGFGIYTSGDPYTELFIHAIDYCIFLFGAFTIGSFNTSEYNGGVTVQMHVQHGNNISGLIELSTHFSWNDPVDIMNINCTGEIITAQYPTSVKGKKSPLRVFKLPTERVLNQSEITAEYFTAGNMVMPVLEMNSIILQGFYKEIETFILLTENNSEVPGANDLTGLKPLYEILKQLKQKTI